MEDLNTGTQYTNDGSGSSAIYEDVTGPRDSSTYWMLTTGALKRSKINNIYDMAGNMMELTMEGRSTDVRSLVGESFYDESSYSIAMRNGNDFYYSGNHIGSRCTLYIK